MKSGKRPMAERTGKGRIAERKGKMERTEQESRIDRILKHPEFLANLKKNDAAEAHRRFCRHNMVHFLDVARIARVINGEEHFGVDLEWIYAAGLLHDIGRHVQYADGTPHEEASAVIAPEILAECGFSEEEVAIIADAILMHRKSEVAGEKNLRGILYRADKASRACFACPVEQECNWKNEKKNLLIMY